MSILRKAKGLSPIPYAAGVILAYLRDLRNPAASVVL
jgi:hypothetical protein